MDYMVQVVLLRLLKFTSVFAYAASVGVGLWGDTVRQRKRAVHLFASPALLMVWLSGYLLTLQTRVSLAEAWVVGGFVASLLAHVLLTQSARHEVPPRMLRGLIVGALSVVLILMVVRPTWQSFLP